MPPFTCQSFRDEVGAELDLEPGFSAHDAHLKACPACRAWRDDLLRIQSALRAAPEPPLPPGFEGSLMARLQASVVPVAPQATGLAASLEWLRRLAPPSRRGLVLAAAFMAALLVLGFPTVVEVRTGTTAPVVQEAPPTAPGVPIPPATPPQPPVQRQTATVVAPATKPAPEAAQPAPSMRPIPLEYAEGEALHEALTRPSVTPPGSPLRPSLVLPGEGTVPVGMPPLAFDPSAQARTPPPIMAVEPLAPPPASALHEAVLLTEPEGQAPQDGAMNPMGMHGDEQHMHSTEGTEMGMHGEDGADHMGNEPMH